MIWIEYFELVHDFAIREWKLCFFGIPLLLMLRKPDTFLKFKVLLMKWNTAKPKDKDFFFLSADKRISFDRN